MPRTALRVYHYRRDLVGFTDAEKDLVTSLKPPHGVRRSHERTFRLFGGDFHALCVHWNLGVGDHDMWSPYLLQRCTALHLSKYHFVIADRWLKEIFHQFAVSLDLSLAVSFFLTLWFTDGSHRTYVFVADLVKTERLRRSRQRTVTAAEEHYLAILQGV